MPNTKSLFLSVFAIIIIAAFLCSNTLLADTTSKKSISIKKGWSIFFINKVGSIELPPTLESQDGGYKNDTALNRSIASPFIAQQKGLNNSAPEAFNTYARVIVKSIVGNVGDFESLNFDVNKVSNKEMLFINNSIKSQIENELFSINARITEWLPVTVEVINGMSCIHISYKRKINNNPEVLVNIYRFQDYDRMHSLILSYNLNDADHWRDDFSLILNSFKIDNYKKVTQ
ncbi:hypothetical protein HGB13_04580 [bacterium]|nr:hypothetical protein [bacterium]